MHHEEREGAAGARAHARRHAEQAAELLPTSGRSLGGGVDGFVDGAGVRLHYVAQGEGPLVVLLHGFPDFWYGWRHQLPALAAAGFRAVAPDLRGYNLSERPRGVERYDLDVLADDVAALVGGLAGPGGQAHLVGHDWGGVIAWHVARRHAAVIDQLAVLNAPHPARFRELLAQAPAQVAASSYVGFFQLPVLPELALGAFGGALLRRTLQTMHRRPGALTARDLDAYQAAFAAPDARRAALDYYRAYVRRGRVARRDGDGPLPHETLVVWGEQDPALLPANADGLERWVPRLQVRRVHDAGHWVMADAPEATNAALVAHFAGAAASAGDR